MIPYMPCGSLWFTQLCLYTPKDLNMSEETVKSIFLYTPCCVTDPYCFCTIYWRTSALDTLRRGYVDTGADPERLERVMRAAVHFGVFAQVRSPGQPVRYRNNHISATLCEDHVQSQKYMVRSLLRQTPSLPSQIR
jgi:hypothetical protein